MMLKETVIAVLTFVPTDSEIKSLISDAAFAYRQNICRETAEIYDNAETFHDGKRVMFDKTVPHEDIILLLGIKRKPNRKTGIVK